MMSFIEEHGSSIIEAPTGSGKTAVEEAVLKAAQAQKLKPCTLIAPNKTIVDHLRNEIPDAIVALGRSEYECLHPAYAHRTSLPMADEIPCLSLDCPSRLNQETGETQEEGAAPCPYYKAKFDAKQGSVVISTIAGYLFNNVFKPKDWVPEGVLVIDEVHRIAEVFRNALSYEVTDHHLVQSIKLLKRIKASETKSIGRFLAAMKKIAKNKSERGGVLLESAEIKQLIAVLGDINANELRRKIKKAVRDGVVSPVDDMTVLKRLEVLTFDIPRYLHSFEYSLPGEERQTEGVSKRGGALNYTCAYYSQEKAERKKVQHKLVIKCYHVAPLIKKVLPPLTVVFSATIGNPDVFGYETGIHSEVLSLDSSFPVGNTRIYMPKDTPDLSEKNRGRRDLAQVTRKIVRVCKRLAKKGMRSLVVTISNVEREKFLMMAGEEGLQAISYGNGVTARDAATCFKDGIGETLVGTAANYSEGIDLPRQTAPVIFFLRPGYPNPRDPSTIFEERRFGGARWAIWNWRVMQQALQVRGRNIRFHSDVGVTFFISQQFRRFLQPALPEWLQSAYCNQFTLEEAVADAETLLGQQ